MKSLTKKLLASVFVMVFALVAVATTTFAWFTISNEATVGPIDVDVRADSEDLTVKVLKSTITGTPSSATDSVGFIKGLTEAEINQAIYGTATDGTVKFDAVSSIDGTSFYKLNAPTGSYLADGTTWRDAATQANYKGSYLSFVLEFKSSSTGYLVLTNNTKATASDTTLSSLVKFTWNGTSYEEKGPIVANAVDPLRMSFTSVGKNVTQKTILYNPASASAKHKVADDSGIIQGVTSNTFANNIGVLYYQNVWKNNTTVANNLKLALETDGAKINALAYASNLPATTDLSEANFENLKVTHAVIGMFGTKTSEVVDTIKVTVNLWLEGWDADCFNAILNSHLTINLGFGILPKALTEDVAIYV